MSRVVTVVLNWNGKKNTLACLSSLQRVETKGFLHSILVVDNGSTDGSVDAIKREFQRIELIENGENFGFTGGNNRGIRAALHSGADYVFVLNNDTVADRRVLIKLLPAFEDPAVGIASPKIHFEKDGHTMIWYAGANIDWANVYGRHRGVDEIDRGQYDEQTETEYCTGCAMLVKRDVFEKIGLFDERFFAYYEDADFSVRAHKVGFKLVYVSKALVFHKNAASSGGTGSKLQEYFIPRNRLLFAFKHASWRTRFALLREAFGLSFSPRRQGVLDFFLGRFGKGSYTEV